MAQPLQQQPVVLQALKICQRKEFGPIKIDMPKIWPGMQMTLNQVDLSKKGRRSIPILCLTRASNMKRLDEEPTLLHFIVVEDEDQLATANKLLEPVLDGNTLKHGNMLSYSQLLVFDRELNGQMRERRAALADAVDLLASAIEIDAAHFKGMIPSNIK
jgi:hypothetical protein